MCIRDSAEGAGHQGVQPAAERAALFGGSVGGFELSQNLGLAHHHGIQAGGHAEQMMDGVAAFVPVEMRADALRADALLIGEEGIDDGLRVGPVVGGEGDFDAIAGGEDDGFSDSLAGLQIGQSGRQCFRPEGQALAHLNGRRFVTHAGDVQLHDLNKRSPRRAWAAQVSAAKPTTVIVMIAALRPRHPATVRRKTRAI